MIKKKKKISPEAFINSMSKAIDFTGQKEALEEKFRIAFKDRIQELYEEFLFQESIERLAVKFPALKGKISDTPLSNRTKNCLRAADVETVADLVQYSPGELRYLRNMGGKSVKEIEEFIAGLGI